MKFEITSEKAKSQGLPDPIWWAKACRQMGVEPEITEKKGENGKPFIAVILPSVPEYVFDSVLDRARTLAEREAKGLPTEERPSGGLPDSEDEVDEPFALRVFADGDGKVCLDLGRAVRAVSIHPAAALHLSTLLTAAAFSVDGALENDLSTDITVQVATVKGIDGKVREAVVRLPSPFAGEEGEEGEDSGDIS